MNEDEREYLIGSAALRLAPDTRVYQALTSGQPVPRSKLTAGVLDAIEEPVDGPPIALDVLLALRVEAALGVVDGEEPARAPSAPAQPIAGGRST